MSVTQSPFNISIKGRAQRRVPSARQKWPKKRSIHAVCGHFEDTFYDRGRKFAAYRQLESLQEYLLIDPNDYSVDCFRRDTAGHWVPYPFGEGEQVAAASLSWSVPIAALYEGVTVSPQPFPEEAER